VHAFFVWLREVGRVGHNPFNELRRVDARREENEDKRALADTELERLFALDVPEVAIYYIAYTSGIRWDELRQITWGQVDVDATDPVWILRANVTKNAKHARYEMVGDAAGGRSLIAPEQLAAKGPGVSTPRST